MWFLRATREIDMYMHIPTRNVPLLPMDHNNYAKYLTICFASLINVNHAHPGVEKLHRDEGISVSMLTDSNSRVAVD